MLERVKTVEIIATARPVGERKVKISISIDGGKTFQEAPGLLEFDIEVMKQQQAVSIGYYVDVPPPPIEVHHFGNARDLASRLRLKGTI